MDKPPEHEIRDIRRYVELEAEGEQVTHLQKLRTEHVYGETHDIWDVRTDKHRYWVITNLTNLYSQDDWPDVEILFVYHLGLRVAMGAQQMRKAPEESVHQAPRAWRKFEQAAEEFNRAQEAEDFQSVGVRLREALVTFLDETIEDHIVPRDKPRPKAADFKGWTDLLANYLAPGESNQHLRSLLKSVRVEAWEFVNWLTHARNAVRYHGEVALGITATVLATYGSAVDLARRPTPSRCVNCGSYRLVSDYRPGLQPEGRENDPSINPYVIVCVACGWEGAESTQPAEQPHS
jgi:hypothetical protein